MNAVVPKSHKRTVATLAAVVVGMFAFGYALVPLYDVFCEITGIGGKTGRTTAEAVAVDPVDTSRLITVQFMGTEAVGLPWEFGPITRSVKVHPGAVADATYFARNLSSRAVTGQAVPSVAPQRAARHFKKTECFCFVNQLLEPGERKEMPIRFVVDRDVPANVDTITLSYSFFNADKFAEDRPEDRVKDAVTGADPAPKGG